MMENFYTQLEQAIENEKFIHIVSNLSSPEQRKRFLVRSLNYLISTRNLYDFEYYITHFHRLFPEDYLAQKGMTKPAINQLIFENYIKNGYLFHVTPSYNAYQIISNGMMTLNDRTNSDLYQRSLKINQIYNAIRRRNSGELTLSNLITIPGEVELNEERFNCVYLSSNLEYILDTYGYGSEFSEYFVRNVFWGFGSKKNYQDMSKEEIREEMIGLLESDKLKIKDEEIDEILGYFNIVYREKTKEENDGQSIVFVPIGKVVSTPKFEMVYKKNKLGFSVPTIIDFDKGEVINKGSITPDGIAVLAPDENKCLRLIKK